MEEAKIGVAIAAFVLSLASFLISLGAASRAKKAEAIKSLLGSKETVAFAALKILRDGLPKSHKQRQLTLAAIVQACVFTSSDRARALLYRVIEVSRSKYQAEYTQEAQAVRASFQSMGPYEFEGDDLDLARGNRRLAALQRVIDGLPKVATSGAVEAAQPAADI